MKKYLTVIALLLAGTVIGQPPTAGIFDSHDDVGNVLHKGNAVYHADAQEYELSGAGTNIWFNKDEFHFAWKKMTGDFMVRATGAFVGKGVELHRKWGWMVRTSLDTASAHVNAVVHGDGLTSLQYRPTTGAQTSEIKSAITAADVVQLERKGNKYIMSVARNGELFTTSAIDSLNLGDEVYVGLFVCSHNPSVVEKAVFKNVRIIQPAPASLVPYKQYLGSQLEILDVPAAASKIIYQSKRSLQAPNWTLDGKSLIYNSEGLLYNYDLATNQPTELSTGFIKHNNNDHVISFDGRMLGISSHVEAEKNASIVYSLPVTGGEPKRITAKGPSYLHGWSPDSKYLVYTGQRDGEFDIYRISSDGGEETRLTTAQGLDDGSEYSPDGKYIYFNSSRTGTMQLWRMQADGSNQEQVTNDSLNNWFPHISPDGKWIAYLSFGRDVSPTDHPFYKQVYLRLMPAAGGASKVIAYLYGGQGTINTPSWSPDSKRLAFISNSNLMYAIFPMEMK